MFVGAGARLWILGVLLAPVFCPEVTGHPDSRDGLEASLECATRQITGLQFLLYLTNSIGAAHSWGRTRGLNEVKRKDKRGIPERSLAVANADKAGMSDSA